MCFELMAISGRNYKGKLGSAFLAILIVMLIALGCIKITTGRDPNVLGRDPNVLLIVIDTLRADHLGCYGYERDTSPNIDRFSKTGVLFQNTYCQIPTTAPSFVSIITAKYPRSHGVLKNGWVLSNTHLTLAEILKRNGYTTSAVISSFPLSSKFGYSRGFDHYEEGFTKDGSSWKPEYWQGHKVAGVFDQRADVATRKAINWLRHNGKEKFFLLVHYFDPHYPYDPPEAYVKSFLKASMSPNERNIANYDGEIRFMDSEVGKLLNTVKSVGLDANTLIIIMADHGEGLGQHGWMQHGMYLYDEQVRIPLIMSLPDVIPTNTRLNSITEAIDIAPTILDLLGLESEKGFSGESLAPMIQGVKTLPRSAVFIERRHYKAAKFANFVVRGNKFAVRHENLKYIWAAEEGTKELYNMHDDPEELSNVVEKYPDAADRLEKMIIIWKNEQEGGHGHKRLEQSIDSQSLEKLKSLGYVE